MKTEEREQLAARVRASNLTEIDPTLIDALPTEPRLYRDAKADETLKAQIEQEGIIDPLLVVTAPEGRYGRVRGSRRQWAALALGIKTVPALIADLTPEEAHRLQLIDAIQHPAIHPMDEARLYKSFKDELGWSDAQIARETGREWDQKHITQMLKLNSLIPEAQEEFFSGGINVELAIELAKYEPKLQKPALSKCYRKAYINGEIKKVPVALGELQDYMRSNQNNLKNAGFSMKDETLLEGAGSCVACPKRSGAEPLLFDEIADKDICTDPSCFKLKRAAYMAEQRRKATMMAEKEGKEVVEISTEPWSTKFPSQKMWEKVGKNDKGAVVGIIAEGEDIGRVLYVAMTKYEPKAERAPEKLKEEYEKEERNRRYNQLYAHGLFLRTIAKAPKKLTAKEDLLLLHDTLTDSYNVDLESIEETLGLKGDPSKWSVPNLTRFIIAMCVSISGMQTREATAKRWKVNIKDVKKITRKEAEGMEA